MATGPLAATDWWAAHVHPWWDAFVEQMKPDRILRIFVSQKVLGSPVAQEVQAGDSTEKRNERLLLALRGKDHHIMSLFRRALAETKQMRLSQYLEFSERCGCFACGHARRAVKKLPQVVAVSVDLSSTSSSSCSCCGCACNSLAQAIVICPHDCGWRGLYSKWKEHLSSCRRSQMPVQDSGPQELMARIPCPHCERDIVLSQKQSSRLNASSALPHHNAVTYRQEDRDAELSLDNVKVSALPPAITFCEPAESSVYCTVCQVVLYDPQQANCGHLFCKSCLANLKENSRVCPAADCKEKISASFPDKNRQRSVLSLRVKCTNHKVGCEQTMSLAQLNNHLEVCPQQMVDCIFKTHGCAAVVRRGELFDHMASCKFSVASGRVQCPHCQRPCPTNKFAAHTEHCPERRLPCRNNCGADVPAKKLLEHEKVCQKVQALSNKVKTTAQVAEEAMPSTRAESRHNPIFKQEKDLELLNPGVDEKLMIAVKEAHLLGGRKNVGSPLESGDLPSYEGVHIFQVRNFSKTLASAKKNLNHTYSIKSPPFFAGRHGYKLSIEIFPNGAPPVQDKFLSLAFVLMKGPHDNILDWPFSLPVTFSIIEQLPKPPRKNHRQYLHPSQCEEEDALSPLNFNRPTEDSHWAWGMWRFISHEQLQSTDRKYLVDDTLVIRVEVDTSRMGKPGGD